MNSQRYSFASALVFRALCSLLDASNLSMLTGKRQCFIAGFHLATCSKLDDAAVIQ